jgi:hypothetical protein
MGFDVVLSCVPLFPPTTYHLPCFAAFAYLSVVILQVDDATSHPKP